MMKRALVVGGLFFLGHGLYMLLQMPTDNDVQAGWFAVLAGDLILLQWVIAAVLLSAAAIVHELEQGRAVLKSALGGNQNGDSLARQDQSEGATRQPAATVQRNNSAQSVDAPQAATAGRPVRERTESCEECGKVVPDDSDFCQFCGTPMQS